MASPAPANDQRRFGGFGTEKMSRSICRLGAMCLAIAVLGGSASAASIKVHSSNRYFQDASAKPVFLLGAYVWASVAPAYFNNNPSKYSDMIVQGAPNKCNYFRLSLGINQFSAEGSDPKWSQSHDSRPTPVPFKYIKGKVDLDQWDPVFWEGLKYHCELARKNHTIVHICFFDAVDFRPGDSSWRWPNSFWNVKNQARDFYGDLDVEKHDHADYAAGFYRTLDFINNTGVGKYQRMLIDKTLAETAKFDNVFYELGNELLGSKADWNAEVARYVRSKTSRAVTQNGGRVSYNCEGVAEHNPNTPEDVKKGVAANVGLGCPFWQDPDGSDIARGGPEYIRKAIWYSFTGGAAGWGGFGIGFSGRRSTPMMAEYYKNFATFVDQSGVKFAEMVPQHSLVTNSEVNSCLAKRGSEYVAYILSDDTVTLDLTGIAANAKCRLYDPKTGVWSGDKVMSGGKQTFSKPAGADDWVIHVKV